MQENPELGEFRVQAALERMGIHLSRRTVGRILAANREAEGLEKPSRGRKEKREMPFAASFRHEYWTSDVRYVSHSIPEPAQAYVVSRADDQEIRFLRAPPEQRAGIAGEALQSPGRFGLHRGEKAADILRRLHRPRMRARGVQQGEAGRQQHCLSIRPEIGVQSMQVGTDRSGVLGRPTQRLSGRWCGVETYDDIHEVLPSLMAPA